MEIILNGKPREIPESMSATQLIDELDLAGKRLAMEVNREIVPRSTFNDFRFSSGDIVEIVAAIGGG